MGKQLWLELVGTDPRGPALGEMFDKDGARIGELVETVLVGMSEQGYYVFRARLIPNGAERRQFPKPEG